MKFVHSSLSCVLFWGCNLFPPLLWPLRVDFLPPGTHLLYYSHPSTYFYEQNPSAVFMYFTHATPSLTLPLNTTTSQPRMPPHRSFQPRTEVAALGSSSWLFLPQEKTETATRNTLPLGKKQKASHTSKPHHKHLAEALPKPPHTQLSAAFSLKWDVAWLVTSFLAFSSSSRSHSSFHTSSLPELQRPINNQVAAGAWEVRPWSQRKPSSVCPQTKTL